MLKRSLPILCLLVSVSLFAQKDKWPVENPADSSRYTQVTITTDEGTWMNLDVSPDGKTIAFDMLGDIYTMPITGGEAKALRTGLPFEVQPRFSPDGKWISFTSDAGGGDNIWVMKTDGSDARQVTKESFRLLNNAVWMPDGQYLVARKHFTSTRSLGAGEMWMYHITGGDGMQLTKKKNAQQDVNEPSVSPEGRYVYYSEDVYPGGYFQYNKDPNGTIYAVQRFDRETGETKTVASGPGGACRPQISRDGKKLAYIKRDRTRTVLYVQDLKTGIERPLFDSLSKDQQEAWAIFGVYTGFSWTPDNKNIIIWGNGKIWNVDAATGKAQLIPFKATATHRIHQALKFKQDPAPDNFDVKVIRDAVTSPDGKLLVFNAVGHIWKKALPDGKAERISTGSTFEFEPAFSPDGRYLAYTCWDDVETGGICILDLKKKNAKSQHITHEKGIYRKPSWSPDGKRLVFEKEEGNDHQGFTYSVNPGIYWMEAQEGTEMHFVTDAGNYPTFSKDGKRIYYQTGGYLFGGSEKAFKSVDLNGQDSRTHYTSKYTNRFVISPDEQWIAFNELFKVYIAPFAKTGHTVELSATTNAVPVQQVARDAGINLHWSGDSKKLHWTLGDRYFTTALQDRFAFLPGAPDSLPALDTVGLAIGLNLPTDKPEGVTAFTNARIITMKGNEVIENGVLVVQNNKIIAVGKAGEVQVPAEAKVYDVAGKTIMPGIVDVHAHLGTFRYGLSPQKQWSYFANLAYGVTTTHDPSSNTEMVFSQSEMVKAGYMVGPRIFSTGIILYGADGDFKAQVNSLEDARFAIRRTKAFGAFSVKSYNQPRREQRQQIIQAAFENQMMVVPEGGSFFYHNLSQILDGHTGIEHNIPVAPVYNDVIKLWSASKTGYTPTLIVNYGGVNGEYYWYQHTNVWEKNRLLRYTPKAIVDGRSRHRTMIPEEEYYNGYQLVSRSCKILSDSGVKVNLGAHGQLQGLGAHWELWMLQQGGMSNLEALRSATLNGAAYIGMDHAIGSLEVGKLADLIIIDGNPLQDIRQTENVTYTMVNGRLYNAQTMQDLSNPDRTWTPFYWQQEGSSLAYPFYNYGGTHGFHQERCGCRH